MRDAPPHPGEPYFAQIGQQLGRAYLRYGFTKGTEQEVAFLLDLLKLPQGARVLDVGCGPGRHAVLMARAGLNVTGIDVSLRFLEIAGEAARAAGVGAAFFEVDARQMPFEDEFDAVISICQGGFGLMGADDSLVLRRMMEAATPGGTVVLTAFSAYFQVTHLDEGQTFDADAGIVHERSHIKDEAAAEHKVEMWTSVYTPRELRLLALGVGLIPESVWAVTPGAYARRRPDTEHPEFLLVARKPK
ncbi:MAG TPA: class I SAM-dependent methyltransferase [Actinomycetota bacterium]|jgi:ubiquinone/menaquinone biosynthesis C-methylase UbiE|nr:class I SAM-dependent methyltransferase [Actinomycetota bacterium]